MTAELSKRDKQEVKNTAAEQFVDAGTAFAPDVDIYSNNDETVFIVDLPGVEKGNVNIEVTESDTLVIRAKSSHTEPKKNVLREYNTGNYYRAFQISDEYDKDHIQASLENGQLEIRLARREELKPRRIKISA